jgi:hypothetical protein
VAPCRFACKDRSFGGNYCLHFQGALGKPQFIHRRSCWVGIRMWTVCLPMLCIVHLSCYVPPLECVVIQFTDFYVRKFPLMNSIRFQFEISDVYVTAQNKRLLFCAVGRNVHRTIFANVPVTWTCQVWHLHTEYSEKFFSHWSFCIVALLSVKTSQCFSTSIIRS